MGEGQKGRQRPDHQHKIQVQFPDGSLSGKPFYNPFFEILAFQFCLDNGIGEFANRFGLTARQFGENLDWKRHEVEQDPMTVDEVTEEYVSSTFPDRKNVLESGIFMVAKELSRQPLVGNLVSKNINGKISGKGKGTESIHPAGDNDCKADENRPKSVGRLSSLL